MDHADHQYSECLEREQYRRPCRSLLHPLENRRSNAQFFFSPTFVDYLVNKVILAGPWDSVICIGCPTIFEAVHQSRAHKPLSAFLLDYDSRLYSFFSARHMLIYNMFNGHSFSPKRYFDETFLATTKNCLVVVDPPFGGLHRALSHSIDTLFQCKDIQRNLILFNPYFLERWIVDAFPRLTMLDYKIEYASQSALHLCRGKKGSPVRIFTDICPSTFPPLDEMNYKYCLECNRYTLVTNQHCFACQACTSKDGLPYRHCSLCRRCVKAQRVHCTKCNVCHLPNQCMSPTTTTSKRTSHWSDIEQRRKQSKIN